jgi:hypothetical protein
MLAFPQGLRVTSIFRSTTRTVQAALLLALAFSAYAVPAAAADEDRNYCAQLAAHLAMSYTDGPGGDIVTTGAMVDCRNGNFAEGIAALERKLRNHGYTLPPREQKQ